MALDEGRWGTAPAVLVVDVAQSKADPTLETSYQSVTEATERIQELLSSARASEVPVFFTLGGKSYHISTGVDLTEVERGCWLRQNDLREESPETAQTHNTLFGGFEKRQDEVLIRKSGPSAFFNTMLQTYLSSLKVDTTVITGFTTSGCLRATVVDAFSRNYHVALPRECIADSRPEVSEFHLDEMDTKYADVESLETICNYLESV